MRFLQHAIAALSLGFLALTAGATPASPQAGTDYRVLDKPVPVDAVKKVEVIEFFWYACPHCYAFDPMLTEWVKKQGNNIEFKRIPVNFRDSFVPQQKMFYALEAMGKGEELHKKIFDAIHMGRERLDTDAAVIDWVAKQGVDKQKFTDLYNSFAVQTKVRRATQLQGQYQVDGVPLIAIDGRYETSPSIVAATMGSANENALHTGTLQVMDWLVAKVAKDKGFAKK
jgi:thiol:disulfide interchange protein DsbA